MIEESWTEVAAYLEIHVDWDAVQRLQLEITLESVRHALATAPKLKIAFTVSDAIISARRATLRFRISI